LNQNDSIAHFRAYEALVKKREEINKKIVAAERSYTEVQSAMENTNKQRKKDKTQIDKDQKELDELHKLPEKNEQEIKDCERKLVQLEQDKIKLTEELDKQLTELKEKSEPLTEQRLKYSDELIGLKEAVNKAKEELHLHDSKLKILKQVEVTEARKFETLKCSYEEAEQSLQQMRTKRDELGVKMPEFKIEMTTKAAEMDKLAKEERNLSTQCTKLRDEVRFQITPLLLILNQHVIDNKCMFSINRSMNAPQICKHSVPMTMS